MLQICYTEKRPAISCKPLLKTKTNPIGSNFIFNLSTVTCTCVLSLNSPIINHIYLIFIRIFDLSLRILNKLRKLIYLINSKPINIETTKTIRNII